MVIRHYHKYVPGTLVTPEAASAIGCSATPMFVGDFENAVAREAGRRGMAGVVCGHIHKAELRSVGTVLYANTGDWVETCSALAEREDGTLTLLTFAERVHRTGRAPVRS